MRLKKTYRLFATMIVLQCAFSFGVSAANIVHEDDCVNQNMPNKEHRFSPEEFRQKCDAFISAEAKLTPAEASRFFPLYHEMRAAQRKCHFEKGRLERNAANQLPDDKECLRILNRISALEKEIKNIEESYQSKLLKVIPPSKLLSVKIAEKKFERRMLRKMANKGHKD